MDQSYVGINMENRPLAGTGAPPPALRRHDIYRHVHKGLRALMGEVLTAVGRVDLDDPRDVAGTIGRLNALMALLRSHMHHENQFIVPALEARRPGSGGSSAREHAEHLDAVEMLETYARRVQIGVGAARETAAGTLYRKLALFVAENLLHMHIEEIENNAVLWAAYSDAELVAIEQALVASIPQHRMVDLLRAMVPAVAPAERASLLEDIRRSAPAAVFEAVLAAVRPYLAERDWFKLSVALDRRPVAAEAA